MPLLKVSLFAQDGPGLRTRMYKHNSPHTVLTNRHFSVCYGCCFQLLRGNLEENGYLQQTQLAGTGDGFGTALHLKFVKNFTVMPFDRVQGEEKSLANLPVGEPLGNEL